MSTNTTFEWLETSANVAAKRLLGCELVREVEGVRLRVKIVETEAYDQTDPASHTFGGRTARNNTMFLGAGHLYVYFTYGMHFCCNISCGSEGFGSGVLIRAAEPLEGRDYMEQQRNVEGVAITNGPAKTCQALGIDRQFDGHTLSSAPIWLVRQPALPEQAITTTTRIGISKAASAPRRFYITNNAYVSRR